MYGLNVILSWFVLHLFIGLIFRGCFLIDEILVLIRVTHIFREEDVCADKLASLGFIHKESFHWYNRFPSSLFVEFFMNMYSLPMHRFCQHMDFDLVPPYFFFFCISLLFFFNNTFFV